MDASPIPDSGDPLHWEILRLFSRVSLSIREDSLESLNQLGLSGSFDIYLIDTIRQKPYPSEASKAMSIAAPTVSHMLKRLEKEGHVVRHTDPKDLRRFRFEVTEKGQNALVQGRQMMLQSVAKLLSTLEPDQTATLKHLLHTMMEKP